MDLDVRCYQKAVKLNHSLTPPHCLSTSYVISCSDISLIQIPQCTSPIFQNALLCNRNVHSCAHFCFKVAGLDFRQSETCLWQDLSSTVINNVLNRYILPVLRQFKTMMVTSNGSWCMGIKGEMSGTVCVTFTWYMYIYELFIAFVCFVVCSLL